MPSATMHAACLNRVVVRFRVKIEIGNVDKWLLAVRIPKDHAVLRPPIGVASVIYTTRAALLTRQRFVSFSLNTHCYCSMDSLVLLLHCDIYT